MVEMSCVCVCVCCRAQARKVSGSANEICARVGQIEPKRTLITPEGNNEEERWHLRCRVDVPICMEQLSYQEEEQRRRDEKAGNNKTSLFKMASP